MQRAAVEGRFRARPEQEKRSRCAEQCGCNEGGGGVQRPDELGVEDACDKQQQAVDEDRNEIGQGQLIVEGPGLKASGSENAAFVEHGAVDPRLMQAVAERNET